MMTLYSLNKSLFVDHWTHMARHLNTVSAIFCSCHAPLHERNKNIRRCNISYRPIHSDFGANSFWRSMVHAFAANVLFHSTILTTTEVGIDYRVQSSVFWELIIKSHYFTIVLAEKLRLHGVCRNKWQRRKIKLKIAEHILFVATNGPEPDGEETRKEMVSQAGSFEGNSKLAQLFLALIYIFPLKSGVR